MSWRSRIVRTLEVGEGWTTLANGKVELRCEEPLKMEIGHICGLEQGQPQEHRDLKHVT